ncbi:PGBD4 [Branchiostoma lanceolatum]|uniref:PGBD4 protein n=1 Tax=Branchiostoma lanceolatum TaxID=7740 RepID=A0A8K0AIV8_BRALA|nr:PGBD4 [Branchiostoma lanceolatum]
MSIVQIEEVLEGHATIDSGDEFPFSDPAESTESESDSEWKEEEDHGVRKRRGPQTATRAASSAPRLEGGDCPSIDGDGLPHDFSEQGGFSDQVRLPDDPKPLDFLTLMVPDSVYKTCTEQTNKYARDYLAANPKADHKGISEAEMRTFLALNIAMGLVHQEDIGDYWSRDEVMATPFFPSIMRRDRFLLILKFFHLSDNDTYHPRGHPQYNPMHKLGTIYETLVETFKRTWYPGHQIGVDEGVVPFRGHPNFRKDKPDKYGVGLKAYQLCDATNGYCCQFQLYGGKGKELSAKGMRHDIVSKLVVPYLQKGHILHYDNCYTSPQLFRNLCDAGTKAHGSMRNRKLSTLKSVSPGKRRHSKKEITPPESLQQEYNQYMCAFDSSNLCFRSNMYRLKWWKKAFFHMFSLALVNAHLLQKEYMSAHGKKALLEHKDFQREVVKELISTSGYERVGQERRSSASASSLLRLTERHFLKKIPQTEGGRFRSRTCQVCGPAERKYRRDHGFLVAKRSGHESTYQCEECQVALCITPCMELYHTEVNYQKAWIKLQHPN